MSGRAPGLLRGVFRLPAALALALALAGPARAQGFQSNLGQVVSPVLLVDRDRLFQDSAEGQRIKALIEAERARLEAETRAIEAELQAEEQALTEARQTLPPDEFRARADAFDAKVQALRDDRDRAQARLVAEIEKARADFLGRITPILTEIMREFGGLVLLDRRVALLAVQQVDITDEAIARIDATLAPGDPPGTGAAPDTTPDSTPDSPPDSSPDTTRP